MNQDSPSRAALEKAQPAQEASRRQEVLRAAVEVFSHQGYHGASMEDIARIVGVRKPALYYYFPSKQDLLFASLDQFTQRMTDGLEEIYNSSARPVDKLRQTFYFSGLGAMPGPPPA